jgi:hypothetical protein
MTTTQQLPVLVHVSVNSADLQAGLGSRRQPATLVFTSLLVTAITPTGTHRIPATALQPRWPGIHQTGLRPRDADRLREAAATATLATLTLTARTLTLTTDQTSVTVDRW